MKQVLQSLKDGQIELAEVRCPSPDRGSVLIRTSRSLISAGTELWLVFSSPTQSETQHPSGAEVSISVCQG